jgi:hypothetical protein
MYERPDSFVFPPDRALPRHEYIPTLGAPREGDVPVAKRTFGRVQTSTTVGGRGLIARLRWVRVATRILMPGLDASAALDGRSLVRRSPVA